MKTKKISKKVLRFLELSEEFEKTENQLFNEGTSLTAKGLIVSSGSIRWEDSNPQGICVTRGQRIMVEAERKKAKADRYDEYKALQRELRNYFTALKQIES